MRILLNGEATDIDGPCTIAALLEQTGQARSICAVEINRMVIPRREHEKTIVQTDDTIEIVTLVGGG